MDYLFELMDDLSVIQAMDSITLAIETYEPRVTIDYSKTTVTPNYDKNELDLHLVFSINDLNDQSFSLDKTMER